MKNIFTAFYLIFLFSCSAPIENEPVKVEKYQHQYYDTLEYLVDNSDLIAVVRIPDREVLVDVIEVTKVDILSIISKNVTYSIENSILINGLPHTTSEEDKGYLVVFGTGDYLVFLKHDNGNIYKPLTPKSVSHMFGDNRVYPIWKQDPESDELSSGFTLKSIKHEINHKLKE